MGFLRRYHEEIEADLGWPTLKRFYTGKLSARHLLIQIMHLPRSSALQRAINPANDWSINDHLLATAVDVLSMANWQRSQDSHAKRPPPIERPSAATAKRADTVRDRALALRSRTQQRQVADGG